jgi:hypothetical protein
MARWPSGLRRQTKVDQPVLQAFAIWSLRGRGFESHSRQSFFPSTLVGYRE